MRRKIQVSKNKKVRNATPTEYDGIKFKSKLEVYCHTKLKENNIKAEYESTTFELIPPFTYDGKKMRKMTFTPDFVGKDFIIECKGYMNDVFPIKWKLFQYHLYKNKLNYKIFLPRNQKQINEIINTILKN